MYQLVGNNLDFEINPHIASLQYKKQSIHWFNLMAVKHRILALHLHDDGPQHPIEEMEASLCLPSIEEHLGLNNNMIILVERVLTQRLHVFQQFEALVIRHVPHKYSKDTREKTDQVRH